jgi:DNA polymerase I
MTRRKQHFRWTVVVDFEYEIEPGGLPVPLCMIAHVLDENLKHIRTIRLWRGDFGPAPPFDIGPDTLVVAYSAWAELTCFMVLGWKFPVHVYDLHVAYLATSNLLLPYAPDETRVKPRKGLKEACRAYGVPGWEGLDKKEMAKDIGEGRWEKYGQPAVFAYCEEDVRVSTTLLRRQLTGYHYFKPVNVERVLYWSVYSSKTVAQIQAKGMPIDMALWNLVQENLAAVVTALLQRFDPSFGHPNAIYTPDGEWSDARFEAWLVRAGVPAWPRLETGKIQIDGDAFKLMYGAHPKIEGLHALRDALGVIVRARIPIGPDGRNRPSLFAYGTATGRNAQAKSLFNAHAGMRSFMLFPQGTIAVYIDWRCQEVAVAAARSGDERLMEDYASGDIYHALALMCGLTNDPDIQHWKDNNSAQRQQMKSLQLGINYGMGVRSLAKGLGRHRLIASEVLIRHQQRYPTYWKWRTETTQQAMFDRVIESEYDGWPLHISTSPNKRTLYNFQMQSGGASMIRLAGTWLCEAGLVPNMLVHDGILIEVQNDDQVRQVAEIMRAAGKEVCGGFEVGADVDFDSRKKGQRFIDKRPVALAMWKVVMDVLREIGALPRTGGL